MFVLALNSFHLTPYDDITQGLREYFSETICTQGAIGQVTQGTHTQWMSLNKPWGHCIDGQATI